MSFNHFLFNKLKTGFRLIYLPKSMPIQTLHNRRNKRTEASNEPSIEGWKSVKALNISNTLWSRPLHNVRNFRYISPNPINKHNKAYKSKYQYQWKTYISCDLNINALSLRFHKQHVNTLNKNSKWSCKL